MPQGFCPRSCVSLGYPETDARNALLNQTRDPEFTTVGDYVRTRDLSGRLSNGHRTFESVEGMYRAPVAPGITSLKLNNRWLDIEFRDLGHQTTLVFFHAALSKNHETYPFLGGSMFKDLNVNVLAISDPAIGAAESLLTGWFAGTKRVPLQRVLPRYLRKVQAYRGGQQMLTFGASAGGFAALHYGLQLEGAGIIVINPVTDISLRRATMPAYVEKAWPGWTEEQVLAHISPSVVDQVKQSPASVIAYLQNSQDPLYREEHLRPFLQENAHDPRVHLRMDHWGGGHVTPPKHVMFDAVDNCRRLIEAQARLTQNGYVSAPATRDILLPA